MVLIWNDSHVGTGRPQPCWWRSTRCSGRGLRPARVLLPQGAARLARLRTVGLELSIWRIAETVAIFLGIPLVAGYLTATIGERGGDGCSAVSENQTSIPAVAPFARLLGTPAVT